MSKSRIPSPARSDTGLVTPRRDKPRGPRSVGSPARSNTSMQLTSVIQNFKDKNMESFRLSPVNSRRCVLNDNTDIEENLCNSWWKKLNDTSRDIMEVLENDKEEEAFNVIEEYMDVEVLSQEKKNHTLYLPDSSDGESISSIIVPQRKLFTQKENRPMSKFAQLLGARDSIYSSDGESISSIIVPQRKLFPQKENQLKSKLTQLLGSRDSMATLNKTNNDSDKCEKTIVGGTKTLFGQSSKLRSRPAFPTELLNFFPDKTINKTTEEINGQVRNLFGNKAGVKRKNNFADFIVSESEDEPEIQPKVFAFQKKTERQVVRPRDPSPALNVTTDIDMDDWKHLPSSTMVQTQLEAMITDSPAKKARLSKLSELKESETATVLSNKTKQSNKTEASMEETNQIDNAEQMTKNQNGTINKSVTSTNKSEFSSSKPSLNKSKTSHIGNKIIQKSVVNEAVPENYDRNEEQDEQNQNSSANKSKLSTSKTLNKSKSSPKNNKSTQKSTINKIVPEMDEKEMNDDEYDRLVLTYSDEEPNEEVNDDKKGDEAGLEAHKSKEMADGNKDSKIEQENEKGPKVHEESQEMKARNQDSEVEQKNEGPEVHEESQEIEDENQDSKVEQENEDIENEEENKSQEVESEDEQDNQESENEEDEQNVSQEVESEVEQDNQESENEEDEQNESQEVDSEVEQDNQESENEEDEQNESQEVESDVPVETEKDDEPEENEEINEQNDSQEVENQSQEIENESQEIDNGETDESELEEENDGEEVIVESVCEQHESNEVMDISVNENEVNGEESENNISQEETSCTEEGTPNVTHDTTGRNRKKDETNVKSLEEILHNKANEMESFTANTKNTSIRRTSMMRSRNITPSLAPPRESTGLSEGTKDSSAGNSGWDSHRTTRKTLRKTFGRDLTPRKSLRALVMEKSAKRHTAFTANDVGVPEANSTELPGDTSDVHDYEDQHEVSKRTRQTNLELYLQNRKKKNMEERKKVEEEVRNSLKAPPRLLALQDSLNAFNVPSRLIRLKRVTKPAQKPKKMVKSMIPLDELPQEFLEDMKYKPPMRFRPRNAAWVTKRLYKYLESKLEAKYDYKARVRAEKLVETLYNFTKVVRKHTVAPSDAVMVLKHELARLEIVRTHFEFYHFCHEYLPREVRIKVNPDVVNNIPLPRDGIFADILRGNTGEEFHD